MFRKPTDIIEEEGIKLPFYGSKISKELKVFYNPVMKLNRDLSLLVIKTYFDKPISFCDPMAASGIRQLRFIKDIPEQFEKLVTGDISKDAIKNIKRNFKLNKLSLKKIKLVNANALTTISSEYFHFIEIDPFGSPVPFLDLALQRIKHQGILSVTATDTAALCGTYPNKTLRRYGTKVEMTLWHEELGLRNLIAYCQREAAKYEKALIPMISYSSDHYFKVFFKVEEGRQKALKMIKELSYLEYDKKTQDITISKLEKENSLGKTYVGALRDKEFVEQLLENIDLVTDKKKVEKLLEKLRDEIETVGHYNPHKLQKHFRFSSDMRFEELIEKLDIKGFEVSRPHNNRLGIKTTAKSEDIVKIMKGN